MQVLHLFSTCFILLQMYFSFKLSLLIIIINYYEISLYFGCAPMGAAMETKRTIEVRLIFKKLLQGTFTSCAVLSLSFEAGVTY